EDSRLEESMFLDEVRRCANENKVELNRYSNDTVPNAAPPPGQPPAMANVRTLMSSLEVRGTYEAVRAFMKQLLGSKRLLAVKSGAWGRSPLTGQTVFSFKLNRYVSTTPPPSSPKVTAMVSNKNGEVAR